jgi:hypothetical protein
MIQDYNMNGSATTIGHMPESKLRPVIEFAKQAEKLGQYKPHQENEITGCGTQAASAYFITAQDPIIQTEKGGRLPAVPLNEAVKLNRLKDELEDRDPNESQPARYSLRYAKDGTVHGVRQPSEPDQQQSSKVDTPLGRATPPARTNPLFHP